MNGQSSTGQQTAASSSRRRKKHGARKLPSRQPHLLAIEHPFLTISAIIYSKPFREGMIAEFLRRQVDEKMTSILVLLEDGERVTDGLVVMTMREFEALWGPILAAREDLAR